MIPATHSMQAYTFGDKKEKEGRYLRKKFFIGKLIHAKSYPIT